MRVVVAVLAAFSWVVPCEAGFHFGLGNTAAKKSADVIEEAKKKPVKTTDPGDSWGGASSLASCSAGALYTVLPVAMNEFQGLVPLGNLNPTGHTLPTMHHYFCNVANSTGTVYFPGSVRVTSLVSSENLSSGVKDFSIYFSPCKEAVIISISRL